MSARRPVADLPARLATAVLDPDQIKEFVKVICNRARRVCPRNHINVDDGPALRHTRIERDELAAAWSSPPSRRGEARPLQRWRCPWWRGHLTAGCTE